MKRLSKSFLSVAVLSMAFLNARCHTSNESEIDIENNSQNETSTYQEKISFDFVKRTVLLNNGYEMPIIGIGTFRLTTAQAEESVYNALKVGMRLIDTADIYGNETGVGRGIKRAMQDFGIKREEIFVTSKLWTSSFANADAEVDERLERLDLDYIDLLLLHHTAANDEHAYQAMERGVKSGKIRSIGLSNFYEGDFDRILRMATITPAVLQNETHPYHQSTTVKNHIAKHGTVMEAWYPLGGRGTGITTLSQHAVIAGIAAAHAKSAYQILLRWHLQSGNVAIPGSSNAAHIAENYDIFDFSLTNEEMKRINALEQNRRFSTY